MADQEFITRYWLESGKKVWEDNSLNLTALFCGDEKHREEMRRMQELVPIGPGDRVLDLACGTGRVCKELWSRVAKVVGTDISPDFIAALNYWRDTHGVSNADFAVCDLLDEQWGVLGKKHFERILFFGTSQFILDDAVLRNVLKNCRKHLAPGGCLLIKQTTSVLEEDVTVDHYSEELKQRWVAHYRTVSHMREILEQVGWALDEATEVFSKETLGPVYQKIERWGDTRQMFFLAHAAISRRSASRGRIPAKVVA